MSDVQIILRKVSSGEETLLVDGLVVGRLADSGLVLTEGYPSRQHAKFSVSENESRLEDLGSANGTFVNDQRIEGMTILCTGDKVRFDVEEFEYQILGDQTIKDDAQKTVISMDQSSSNDVTEMLSQIQRGEKLAGEELLPLLYDELRRLARAKMAREKAGQTLQPTALVHEAYMRLVGDEDPGWEDRGHFFAAAAEAMRRILIERARRYSRLKHGGDQRRISLNDGIPDAAESEEILELDEALQKLESIDAVMSNVAKLRYFAGLTVEETAKALDMSPRSVNRAWTSAKAWLAKSMSLGDT